MKKTSFLATATVGIALAALPAAALASDAGIEVQDRCDEASFTAAGIPCDRPADDGGGNVTIDELFATLAAKRSHDGWRFKQDKVTLRGGQPLNVSMTRGGEGHTVTEVPALASAALRRSTRSSSRARTRRPSRRPAATRRRLPPAPSAARSSPPACRPSPTSASPRARTASSA